MLVLILYVLFTEMKLFCAESLFNRFSFSISCIVADMLTQYVEVEQLGPIYVCDACNGMVWSSVCCWLPLYFKAFLVIMHLLCLEGSLDLFVFNMLSIFYLFHSVFVFCKWYGCLICVKSAVKTQETNQPDMAVDILGVYYANPLRKINSIKS